MQNAKILRFASEEIGRDIEQIPPRAAAALVVQLKPVLMALERAAAAEPPPEKFPTVAKWPLHKANDLLVAAAIEAGESREQARARLVPDEMEDHHFAPLWSMMKPFVRRRQRIARNRQIRRMRSTGWSNKRIAEHMGLAESTVAGILRVPKRKKRPLDGGR